MHGQGLAAFQGRAAPDLCTHYELPAPVEFTHRLEGLSTPSERLPRLQTWAGGPAREAPPKLVLLLLPSARFANSTLPAAPSTGANLGGAAPTRGPAAQ